MKKTMNKPQRRRGAEAEQKTEANEGNGEQNRVLQTPGTLETGGTLPAVPTFTTELKERIAAAQEIRVATGGIRTGTANPRKAFNLDELKPNIAENGIISALWVRALPQYVLHEPDMVSEQWRITTIDGQATDQKFPKDMENLARMSIEEMNRNQYELIAGERRFRCALELDIPNVPVKVIDCTPEEAWKLQRIENLQRADLTPLEEAQDYRDAVDSKRFGATVKDSVIALAREVGCSESHIYDRMALLKLSETAREAFIAGAIDISIAKEISAVPGEKAQKQIIETHELVPFSVRKVREYIERCFMRKLESAPFDVKDDKLVLTAGACRDCPKRTGNMVEQFPHLKGTPNVCTDTGCYDVKGNAHRESLLMAAREKGLKVLTAKESKPLFHRDYLMRGNGYVKADEVCGEDKQKRTHRQLARLVKLDPVVCCDGTGAVVDLFETEPLTEKLLAKKIIKPLKQAHGNGELGLTEAPKRETEEERVERMMEEAVAFELTVRAVGALVKRIEATVPKDCKALAGPLRWILTYLCDSGSLALLPVYPRRNWPAHETVNAVTKEMTAQELLGVLFEASLAEYGNDYNGIDIEEACRQFGVDDKKLEKDVRAEMKEQFRLPTHDYVYEVPEPLLRLAQDSYSGQRIAEENSIREPFDWRGRRWVCTSGGGQVQCVLVLAPEDFKGQTGTFLELGTPENGYHGVRVNHGSTALVLSNPRIVLKAAAEKPAPVSLAKQTKRAKGGKKGRKK